MCFVCRGLGPWGPGLVNRYTTARFGAHSEGTGLTEEEAKLLTGNVIVSLSSIEVMESDNAIADSDGSFEPNC